MTWILEDPLPTIILGVLLEIGLVALLLLTGQRQALYGMAAVIVLAGLGLLVERWVVTDREAIEELFERGAQAVNAHDIPTVIAMIDPGDARLQATVRRALDQMPIKHVKITHLAIEVDSRSQPPTATAEVVVFADLDNRKGNVSHDHAVQPAHVDLRKQGQQWFVAHVEAREAREERRKKAFATFAAFCSTPFTTRYSSSRHWRIACIASRQVMSKFSGVRLTYPFASAVRSVSGSSGSWPNLPVIQ
jgi:hypothetical protein